MNAKLFLSTKLAQSKTQLDQYFATPPFKVLTLPNYAHSQSPLWEQELNAMQMSSSPGLLAGDELNIALELAPNTALNLHTQAFTRVQAMHAEAYAHQHTQIKLAENSGLFYLPHPLVLHKDSAFKQRTDIEMSANSQLIYGEIVAIGRVLNDERFAFRHFASYLRVNYQNRPLLRDRIQWLPAQMKLTALSQMEDFSHQGALSYFHLGKNTAQFKTLVQELQQQFSQQNEMLIGISQLHENGLMVRVLAHRADDIQQYFQQLGAYLKAQ